MMLEQTDRNHSQIKPAEHPAMTAQLNRKRAAHSILHDSLVDSPSLFTGVSSGGSFQWQWSDSRRVTMSR